MPGAFAGWKECPVCKGEGGFKKKEGDHYRYDGDCLNCGALGVINPCPDN